MKIKWGALVTAGSGKIGGHVVSRNRGGSYLRTKAIAVNPNSDAQRTIRGVLSSLSSAWSGLTDAQRQSWNGAVSNFAKTDIFGDLKNPSGFNLFIKLNANLASVGIANLVSAPDKVEVIGTEVTAASLSIGTDEISLTGNLALFVGKNIIIYATPPMSAGVSFIKNSLRQIGYYVGTPDFSDIYADYVARFGVPALGANVSIGFQIVETTGQKSILQVVKMAVVA